MTPEELTAQFRDWKANGVTRVQFGGPYHCGACDHEIIHSEMDKAVVAVLRELGYGEAMDEFESATRWYS